MYNLIVIGSGPAGEKGAAQAAYFGKRVALIEREPVPGGACVNTGTVPSKTLRESALHLSGFRQRGFRDAIDLHMKSDITVPTYVPQAWLGGKGTYRRKPSPPNVDATSVGAIVSPTKLDCAAPAEW